MRNDYIVQVNGQKKSGKSSLVFGVKPIDGGIIQWVRQTQNKRIFVFDTAGVCKRGTLVQNPERLRRQLVKEEDPSHEEHKEAREWMKRNDWIYTLRPNTDKDTNNFFKLFAHGKGKPAIEGVFIIDEVDDSRYMSRQKVNKYLERMIKYGGNKGQDFILACRRYNSVNVDIRTQADGLILYKQSSKQAAEEAINDQNVGINALKIQQMGRHDFTTIGDFRDVPFANRLKEVRKSTGGYVEVA